MKRLSIALAVTTAILLGNVAVAQEEAGVPEEIVKELSYLVGTWKSEGNIGGEDFAGTHSFRWVRSKDAGKYCLSANTSVKIGEKDGAGFGVIGWDAGKKQIADHHYTSGGGCFTLRWTVISSKEWRAELYSVQGGKEAVKGKAVLIKKGPAEYVYEEEMDEGEAGRLVFRKVSKERKPRKAKKAEQ